MKAITIAVALVAMCPHAAAQDDKTSAFEMAHPETREPGVWIPVWLQQEHLQTDAKLQTCTEESVTKTRQLAEKGAEAAAAVLAATELRDSVEGLEMTVAAQEQALQAEEAASEDRLVWAWTSTAVGVVALSVLAGLLAGG